MQKKEYMVTGKSGLGVQNEAGPHSINHQNWKTQQGPQDWKRSAFITVLDKGNAKECLNYHTITLISHASNVMLKILQARLQQYMNWKLPAI